MTGGGAVSNIDRVETINGRGPETEVVMRDGQLRMYAGRLVGFLFLAAVIAMSCVKPTVSFSQAVMDMRIRGSGDMNDVLAQLILRVERYADRTDMADMKNALLEYSKDGAAFDLDIYAPDFRLTIISLNGKAGDMENDTALSGDRSENIDGAGIEVPTGQDIDYTNT